MRSVFNVDGPMMRGLSRVCDLMWLNVLTVICCIPIVTIGPAITALYYITMKVMRGEEGYLTKPYFAAFRDNFKKSILIWIVMMIVGAVMVADFIIVFAMDTSYRQVLLVALMALSILLSMMGLYVFPLQARFENTCRATVKNAFLLSITQLPKSILMLVIHALPWIVIYFVPYVSPLILMLGIALPVYGCSYFLVKIFGKIEEAYEESVADIEVELEAE